jgi:hypothetical protein
MSDNKLKEILNNKRSNIKIDVDEEPELKELKVRATIEKLTGESLEEDDLTKIDQSEVNDFLKRISKTQSKNPIKQNNSKTESIDSSNALFDVRLNPDAFKSLIIHWLKTDESFLNNVGFYIKRYLLNKDKDE